MEYFDLNALPVELRALIYTNATSPEDLLSLALVDRRLNYELNIHALDIWKAFCQRDFPRFIRISGKDASELRDDYYEARKGDTFLEHLVSIVPDLQSHSFMSTFARQVYRAFIEEKGFVTLWDIFQSNWDRDDKASFLAQMWVGLQANVKVKVRTSNDNNINPGNAGNVYMFKLADVEELLPILRKRRLKLTTAFVGNVLMRTESTYDDMDIILAMTGEDDET